MKKIKTKSGWIAYETTLAEIASIGGFGICDYCGEIEFRGYLIPVLNEWYCPDCFNRWQRSATYYLEDVPFEQAKITYYESMIPVEWEEGDADAID